ncbi:MAG: 8-amino-7-oxononanoate synthase [Kiritimatiellia bacterium]|nr:8-amino-7-oxononanoate synthase [Kiritimatiellia bacterium]
MPTPVRRPEAWIPEQLERLEAQGLRRYLSVQPFGGSSGIPGNVINLASNDYLGLARHPEVLRASILAMQQYGAGAGASRLLTGTLPCHEDLEIALADLKGMDSALVFGSGYAANVGILSALVARGDHAFADRLAHASLIDGVRLSGATLHRFRHNDPDHLRRLLQSSPSQGKRLVLTESVFSMDGDLSPLQEIAQAAREAGAMLLVDEAHATGIFGPGGAGRVRELGLENEVSLCMGTLSKALGSHGGFVACSAPMRDWLIQRARSFFFSTALPPAAAGAALGALDVLRSDPDAGRRLLSKAERFRDRLSRQGISTLNSRSAILPVPARAGQDVVRIARLLRDRGILVGAIRPPTVPPGTSRLRVSLSLLHKDADLDAAADEIGAVIRAEDPA